ncbi:FMN-dependent NADH-azoreductase [Roseomonas hellenica]|uniref:FMN dependent NADH:quinone oxidoreductase n=1 Tax=Plastoroseomonas hellenica TaxID=2687306 RepID=A0ABS5EXF9_9PROT|nr:FMN-dependent NADH-azoreductase [Plastoroseomonas hellenica]MBR0664976.1 FMN-dependent NADH-azoreductase [Plastoroseomonas hellenica]
MKLLRIDSSVLGDNSVSRRLSAATVTRLRQKNPGLEVTYRDLAAAPVAHFSGALLAAFGATPDSWSTEQQQDVAHGGAALEEFLAADVVVIGAPMYNFTVSTQLKAWIDRLAVVGKTFRYTEKGAEGLAGGKKVIIVSTRGGIYSTGPAAAADHQEPYLRTMLGFFGITDIEVIRAEGLALGAEQKQQAIDAAERQIALAA